LFVLWHVDPLLGNDHGVRGYTTAVVKQRLRKQACFHGNICTAIMEQSFCAVHAEMLYIEQLVGESQFPIQK
jgi:hypothetical protein